MPVSRIREIMELAWEDPEVIHLEVGEPDFPTPSHIVDAAHEAARAGHTRYAPNAGLPELREALADKVARRNGYEARPDQIVVTQGASRHSTWCCEHCSNRATRCCCPTPPGQISA
jgi:aspartate/methionine/tyrosine aminotransferase